MTIQSIHTVQDLKNFRKQWNCVSQSKPFQSWEWCYNWLKYVEPDAKPCLIVESGELGQWTGIAPMAQFKTKFGENKLVVLGSGSTCTDYSGFVSGAPQTFAAKFAGWVEGQNECKDSRIEVVEFDGIELGGEGLRNISRQLESTGYLPQTTANENCWRLDLPDSWEKLDEQFSKKHRRKTRKAVQRLQETTVSLASRDSFEDDWDSFVNLHQLRRKMLGQDGCFERPGFEEFLRSATAGLMERDLAKILKIKIAGQAVASTLILNDGHNVFMYQTGFDPDYKKLEPGYMLIVAALQWSIENHFGSFDFLRGDEPYKARWNTTPVPIGRVRFVDSTRLGALARNRIWNDWRSVRQFASKIKSQYRGFAN